MSAEDEVMLDLVEQRVGRRIEMHHLRALADALRLRAEGEQGRGRDYLQMCYLAAARLGEAIRQPTMGDLHTEALRMYALFAAIKSDPDTIRRRRSMEQEGFAGVGW